MSAEMISSELVYPSKYLEVLGSNMHYIEVGEGDPILFLHGVPTSCYLWRNIIPHLTSLGRCIAPDLIGMGNSDKPNIDYSVTDHIHYLEQFIANLKLKNIVIVMHGWGSVIGFDYAMRHPNNCKGLVFYEAFLRSLNGVEVSLPLQEQILMLEGQESFDDFELNGVAFVDKMIPANAIHSLPQATLDYYRKPFTAPGSSKPIFQYLKELPSGVGASKVDQVIEHYSKKLSQSNLPKLLLYSLPGLITTMATVMWAKEHLPNLEIMEVGEELHFAQESSPQLMGEAISVWLQGIEQQ